MPFDDDPDLRRRVARDMADRSTVRVMRDGRPNSVDSNRIISNNITSEAMERVSGRMGRMRNPEEEVDPRSRLARRAANYMAGLEGGMKKGGIVKPNYGSTEDIVGHGKTQAAAKADYARKMKAAGLKPRGMAAGGSVASKRADGCAARGKTKGRMV
jgi:hypothetical protein